MKLYIKYMVSLRCKMFVKEELHKMGFKCLHVDLGSVEIKEDMTQEKKEQLKIRLRTFRRFKEYSN